MTDLRKLFDEFNQKTGNKLVCKKLYIVPAMKYWIDYTDPKDPEVITAILQLEDNPYFIKSIKFNSELTEEEMIDILKGYVAQVYTLGNHWEEYVTFKKSL